jgi:hypothetical protein
MDLDEVVSQLNLEASKDALGLEWESSRRSLSAGGFPFLHPDAIAESCSALFLSDELRQAVVAAAERVAGDASLRALAWHCHYCLFLSPRYPEDRVWGWPSLEEVLQEQAAMFYLLVLLSGMPRLPAYHQAHGVSADVVRGTLAGIGRHLETARSYRPWGLTPSGMSWAADYIRGNIYRLGLLEFHFGKFDIGVRVFRHQPSGTVLAMADDSARYGPDGQLAWEGHGVDRKGVWTARFVMTGERILGHPILPIGRALREPISLPRAEWSQKLSEGDPILRVHIPGGSPLAHDLCGESFRRALDFFPRHFPERPFSGFRCCSWVLNARFQELLPPTSNMVRFQREVYLVPFEVTPERLLESVFGAVPDDLTKAPRKTGLQRALLAHLQAGGDHRVLAGGCFLLVEDVDKWGAEVYRRQDLNQFLKPA